MFTAITLSDVTFRWPDGTPVVSELNAVFGAGVTGLIGANGSGKSTLLRLIAGQLAAVSGAVTVTGTLGYLAQRQPDDGSVAELMGVRRISAAVAAISSGEATAANFAIVGDRWDAVTDARVLLDRLGLNHIELDRPVRGVPGGEATLIATAGQLLAEPDVLLLDEPTNNLDADARARLYEVIADRSGATVVASHDRDLLERVTGIAELRAGQLRQYGGTLSQYQQLLDTEAQAGQRAVRDAATDLKRQRRELVDAEVKLSRRKRYGQKMWDTKREPKVVMGERKRAAQVSAGKHRREHQKHVEDARDRLSAAQNAVRDDALVRIELPATRVPTGRVVLNVDLDADTEVGRTHQKETEPGGQCRLALQLQGPERIAVTGRNGIGKTTLLATIVGERSPAHGEVDLRVPVGYLPQRIPPEDTTLSIAQSVAAAAPTASPNTIRAQLARFLFRGAAADAALSTLSGGERFRARLAKLLLAEPAPQLLVLDEPTNALDLASLAQLVAALNQYEGALIVASHDETFLDQIGVTRRVRLE